MQVAVLAFAVVLELCSDKMEQMYSVFQFVVESHKEAIKHNECKKEFEEVCEEVLVKVTVLEFVVDSELCSDEMKQRYSVFRHVLESH